MRGNCPTGLCLLAKFLTPILEIRPAKNWKIKPTNGNLEIVLER
jgi:hypothetical protein